MKTFDPVSFRAEFEQKGYVIIEDVLDQGFVQQTLKELEVALEKEVEYHGTTDYSFYGYVMANAMYGGKFLELFDNELVVEPFNTILGESCMAYSYTSSSMPPSRGNDSSHVHVDSPIFLKDYILRMGMMIPLVDFTEDNGATYFLPASHDREEMPGDEEFYANAERLIVKAGTAFFFNTRLWHAGGVNHTNGWRHALTLNMCRPWMKQRVSIPGLMKGMDLSSVSETTLQKLGFYAQVPETYDEYWVPEKRTFTQSSL